MAKTPQELYAERVKRFDDAVSLRVPDRVPLVCLSTYFVTRFAGLTNKEALYEPERSAEGFKNAMLKLNWDMAPLPTWGMSPGNVMEKVGYTMQKWPGYNLPDNVSHQFVEAEYMSADEYDAFLRDPGDFTIRKLLPRISTGLASLADLPPLQRLYPAFWAALPSVVSALQTMIEAAAEFSKWAPITNKLMDEIEALGFPLIAQVGCNAPFDVISDRLRGMRGTMLDMYRCPDKLLATIDYFTEVSIETAIAGARRTGNPRIFMALHRGAGGFMSNAQFAKFYWPSLKKVMLALIDAGLTPVVFLEGDYTPRLEYLAELPRGKVAGHFDIVDLKKCKKILGDTMVFWGNIPAPLFIAGKPQQVKDYVRMLIDTFGDNGGLIVDGAVSGVPDEARPENVAAMAEAVYEYGVY